MAPAIVDGEAIVVEPRHGRIPLPGDVVLYEREGRLTAHRVKEVLGYCKTSPPLVLRGDNSRCDDPLVPMQAVLGFVTGVRRGPDGDTVPVPARPPRQSWAVEIARSLSRFLEGTKVRMPSQFDAGRSQ